MIQRYKRPAGIFLMPADDGEFILYSDRAALLHSVEEIEVLLESFVEILNREYGTEGIGQTGIPSAAQAIRDLLEA